MYNRHIALMTIIFIAIFFLSLLLKLQINKESVNNLITFFSIVFGFYLTAFSVLFGSKTCARFSNEEDPLIKTQTKLHTLKKYFQLSSQFSIISTTMLVIIGLLGCDNDNHKNIFSAFCLGLSAVNVAFILILLKIFLNAFVEEV